MANRPPQPPNQNPNPNANPNYWQQSGVFRTDWVHQDGVELTDDDLDYVVGGLSTEAAMSQMRFLQAAYGLKPNS